MSWKGREEGGKEGECGEGGCQAVEREGSGSTVQGEGVGFRVDSSRFFWLRELDWVEPSRRVEPHGWVQPYARSRHTVQGLLTR